MASSIWYLYTLIEKIKKVINAKPEKESYIPPKRYRKVPPLVKYPEKCISCEACKESCPAFAIEMINYQTEKYSKKIPYIDDNSCIACANCVEVCPTAVLEIDKHREETEGLFFNKPKYNFLMIDSELCVLCGECANACPINIIHEREDSYHINVSECISCKRCLEACPINAIVVVNEKILKEKIDKFFELKIKKETNKLEYKERIPNIPHISKSICINCKSCSQICPGKIDLENYNVVECIKCGYCLEVCPTGAIRLESKIIPKHKDKTYVINDELCIGCRICYKVCKVNAIEISKKLKIPYIIPDRCVVCGLCAKKCPVDAIYLDNKENANKIINVRIIEDRILETMEKDLELYTKKYGEVKEELINILKTKVKEELIKLIKEKVNSHDKENNK
ncbi:4Fe-4S binding protein [Methanocaldococcus indicus]|uniref:4Fe-4S binding protein n=1 Tax=Methanocaldococcus indicus TaxID=213231 RepID=UPI003C6D20AC